MSLELLGAHRIGDGDSDSSKSSGGGGSGGGGWGSWIGPIFQAAGGIANAGINIAEQEQAKSKAEQAAKQATASDLAAAQTAISADLTATLAVAKALVSKSPADQAAAETLAAAQDRAGAQLSPAGSAKRVQAAEAALTAATGKPHPKGSYQEALITAWTKTVNKANNRQIVVSEGAGGGKHGDGESWLTKKMVGPVPGWGVGLGVLGVGGLLVKKFLLH